MLCHELLGQPYAPFTNRHWPTQLKISGIDLYRAGELDPSAEQVYLRDPEAGVYRRLVIRDDRLVGAVLVGDKTGGNWYAELIQDKHNIRAMRRGLMFGQRVAEAMNTAAEAA